MRKGIRGRRTRSGFDGLSNNNNNIDCRLAEENADAILDAKPKKEKSRKGEEIEETVTKSERRVLLI